MVHSRAWREAAALAPASVLLALNGLTDNAQHGWEFALNRVSFLASIPAPLLLGFFCRPLVGAAAAFLIPLGAELAARQFNPLFFVLSAGGWLVGYAVRSRRQIAVALQQRADDLEAEREIFAQEFVRYERARIARELHDIVAHCVSLMVVQAGAGQRLLQRDPAGAGEVFDNILEAAREAQQEMLRLVELLGDDVQPVAATNLRIVEELVGRAQGSGLAISCRISGTTDQLSPAAAAASYRVVQEALTNALKHAPGAEVEVEIDGDEVGVSIRVHNGPSPHGVTPLHRIGGGHGVQGMRERVLACGGQADAGPTPNGGWQVQVHLPVRVRSMLEQHR